MCFVLKYLLFFTFLVYVSSLKQAEERVVTLDVGEVIGQKFWGGEFFEFYGVPYATAPKGRDRFKAPLPLEPFDSIDADIKNIMCPQIFLTEGDDEEVFVHGTEDCLTMNLLVPSIATEDNPLPVLVYIHSGAFAGGNGYMGRLHNVARHDVLVVSFNYRLGALGFACLGTEEIPGNAGLKDQLAALKFVNKYIRKFGGDPNKVTLAGFSVGATMAELLALSKAAVGLFNKLILESGSALAPFAISRNPIDTARNFAISIGFNDTGNVGDLNEFLLNADIEDLAKTSNFFLRNSTFGFSPCLETAIGDADPLVTVSPLAIIEKRNYKKIPVLTGFANMEGLSRTPKFDDWSEEMNENFGNFLPADLKFDTEKAKAELIEELKKYYFNGKEVSRDTVEGFVDYFSDSMFKYSIAKSARYHSRYSTRPVFFYEFTYVGGLSFKHWFMDKLKGASHRDQTAYIWDFFDFTTNLKDLETRDRLTTMWTDFVKYENPTAYESLIIDVKWPKYTIKEPRYLEIGEKLQVKDGLFSDQYLFWSKIYDKYYWAPTPVTASKNKSKK